MSVDTHYHGVNKAEFQEIEYFGVLYIRGEGFNAKFYVLENPLIWLQQLRYAVEEAIKYEINRVDPC